MLFASLIITFADSAFNQISIKHLSDDVIHCMNLRSYVFFSIYKTLKSQKWLGRADMNAY